MEIKIKTTEFDITDEAQAYLEERLAAAGKMLEGDPEGRCDVHMGRAPGHARHGEVWFAEFDLHHTGNDRIHAYARAETINAAIDKARDELMLQLRKAKRFHVRMLRKGGAAIKKMMRWE